MYVFYMCIYVSVCVLFVRVVCFLLDDKITAVYS